MPLPKGLASGSRNDYGRLTMDEEECRASWKDSECVWDKCPRVYDGWAYDHTIDCPLYKAPTDPDFYGA